jgi:hypothetical protein
MALNILAPAPCIIAAISSIIIEGFFTLPFDQNRTVRREPFRITASSVLNPYLFQIS